MKTAVAALVLALATTPVLAGERFTYAPGTSTGGTARALISQTGPGPLVPVGPASLTATGSHAGGPANGRLSSIGPGPVSLAGTVLDPARPAYLRRWQSGQNAGGPFRF